MPKISNVALQPVELMPATLAPGVLYVSERFKTAAHLCCCGCGTKVFTPLKAGGWTLATTRGGKPSLDPSIGNFNIECRSHYWIRNGGVKWERAWTPKQIAAGRAHDHADRQAYFDAPELSTWQRTVRWIRRLIGLR